MKTASNMLAILAMPFVLMFIQGHQALATNIGNDHEMVVRTGIYA